MSVSSDFFYRTLCVVIEVYVTYMLIFVSFVQFCENFSYAYGRDILYAVPVDIHVLLHSLCNVKNPLYLIQFQEMEQVIFIVYLY